MTCLCGCGHTPIGKNSLYVQGHNNQRGKKRGPRSKSFSRKMRLIKLGTRLSEATKAKIRKSHLKSMMRGNRWQSKLEQRGRKLLRKFDLNKRVMLGTHIYDGGNRKASTLVEINGCFWHNHRCRSHTSNNVLQEVKDKRFARMAKKNGFKLIVLWECEESNWLRQLKEEVA